MKVSIEGNNLLLDVTAEIVAIPKLMTKHLHNLAERTVKGVKANIADGLSTDGGVMITRSIARVGRYSKMHAERL
jgi:hypothetical protein